MYKNVPGSILFVGSIFLFVTAVRIKNQKIKPLKANVKVKANEQIMFDQLFKLNEPLVNRNITPELYRYETWEKMNEESDEENVWKKRVLLHNTSHGNIAMYYDLYRQAFAYYSDGHIGYNLLNQCAMKYVRIFNCRDFFVDTMVLPGLYQNPFNKMKEEEETRQKVKASNKRKEMNINFDNSAFVKPLKIKKVSYREEPDEIIPTIYKNNFRCIGKLSGDWNILQPVPPPSKISNDKYIVDDYYDHHDHNDMKRSAMAKTSYSLWKSFALLSK
jgi:hypothetical protein